MIPDNTVKLFFQNFQAVLESEWDETSVSDTQLLRGVTVRKWKNANSKINCQGYKLIFQEYNIIPNYCFECYKVSIEPRTVVELIKLMLILDGLTLPNDNTRKCIIELRPSIKSPYKGFIYCKELEESKDILNAMREIVSGEISPDIPVTLKRGCSEYAIVYPDYAKFNQDGSPAMRYKTEWNKYEKLAEETNLYSHIDLVKMDSYNPFDGPGFESYDAAVMLNWIKYAATIGDNSYRVITDRHVPKMPSLKRPPYEAKV